MSELERFLPIMVSVLALLVSMFTFFLARFFQAEDRKQALTIEMWQRWDSAAMRDQRVIFWDAVERTSLNPRDNQSSIHFSKLGPTALRALNDVEQFLDGLGKLKISNQLNDKLFREFFYPNLSQWKDMSAMIERADDDRVRSSERVGELYSRIS